MNRNVESHFSELPSVDIQRSIFDRSSTHKTSFNCGDLIPIYVDEVLPGDSFQMTTSKIVRAQTMLTPIMDNMYLDTYFFFCPLRLVWDHAREFFGENTTSAWVQTIQYSVPTISAPSSTGFAVNTIADYMGIPTGITWSATDVNAPIALPFRAYAKICDEWFRDQNVTDPLNIPTGDSNQTGSNGSSYINDVANGGMPFKVAKYHDYFTSALPSAAKISQPITMGANPVVTTSKFPVLPSTTKIFSVGDAKPDGVDRINFFGKDSDSKFTAMTGEHSADFYDGYLLSKTGTDSGTLADAYPNNLWADPAGLISVSGVSFTINELRLAFQLQKFYEKQARGGTRYIEILKQHFGVTSPDARLQRTEYLGGNRIQLNVHEVTNSAQSSSDFLGDLGAKSATSDIHEDFNHSFTEHGYIIGKHICRFKIEEKIWKAA